MAQHSSRGGHLLNPPCIQMLPICVFHFIPINLQQEAPSLLMLTSLGEQHSFPADLMQPKEDTIAGSSMYLLQRGLL